MDNETAHTSRHQELEGLCQERLMELTDLNKQLKDQIREHQRVENALSESNQLYRTLVETIPHGIEECDSNGMITFANSAYHRILEYEEGELIGKAIWDLQASEEENQNLREYFQYLLTEKPSRTPYYTIHHTKHGRPVNIRVDWNYKFDASGAVAGFISIITDITAQTRSEREAQNNTLELKTIIETTPYGIIILNRDMTIKWINNHMASLFNYTPEQMQGKNWLACVPEMQSRTHLYEEILSGKKIDFYDVEMQFAEQFRSFRVQYCPLLNVDQEIVGMVAVGYEITQQKQAEKQLRASEEQYRIISVLAPVGICHVRADGVMLYANQSLCEFSGLSMEPLLKQGWLAAVHPDDQERVHIEWEQAYKQQVFFKSEFRFLHTNGTVTWVLAQAQIELDGDLKAICYVCTFTNITKQREAENQLRKHQLEMAHYSRINMIGEMMSGIAHELNQPLTAITHYVGGCIARINSEPISSDIVTALRKIESQAERAGEIIHHLKDFLSNNDFERTIVDINDVILSSIELLEHFTQQEGILIRLQLSLKPGYVKTAKTQLEQVIINLLQNAIDAMREHSQDKRITITTVVNDEQVKLIVADKGGGIDAPTLKSIFYPFFTTKKNGMGMGLSISKTIIDIHEGEIKANNNNDGGCDFIITLPFVRESTDVK